jgi:hypothetical protein
MILLFFIIGVMGIILYTIAFQKLLDKKSDWWMILLILSLAMISGGYMFEGRFIQKSNPVDVHSNRFNLKTEIRCEVINGKEVSRDTVYIFTPKK